MPFVVDAGIDERRPEGKRENGVTKIIENIGNAAAVIGILVCLVAGATRAAGSYYLGVYSAMTLFNVGVGLMVAACLAKLHLLQSS